ncbi:MAG: hypothetical protein BGO78_06630 [Chloroflexi bacterium 44-23]|nr:MAG: hypothetical protein BGO78_06630 [Chloroflexi bacterium 44-23]
MSSTKKSIRKKLPVILIVITLIAMFAAIIYFSGILYFSNILPCYPPPWVTVDGVAKASVIAFFDENRDGIFNDGERPLPNIEIKMGTKRAQTDQKGKASVFVFKEGCICNCSRGETLLITVPEGWQTTTAIEYKLNGKDKIIPIGFFK